MMTFKFEVCEYVLWVLAVVMMSGLTIASLWSRKARYTLKKMKEEM